MMFDINLGVSSANIGLIYIAKDYSFDTSEFRINCVTEIILNDIHLGVEAGGIVSSVWGLCPNTKWKNRKLVLPPAKEGKLICKINVESGIPVRVNESNSPWEVLNDSDTGWLVVSSNKEQVDDNSVEFSKDCIATINKGKLTGLWLRPKMVN